MTFGDGVPRWARRRVERHLARHGDGRVIRWMAFASGHRRMKADAFPAEAATNVVPFIRRAAVGTPGEGSALDATGS